MTDNNYEPWPALSYEEFKPTSYLLHMTIQAIGKLKLTGSCDPQWANVALWLTSSGITTGQVLYGKGTFTVELDLIDHEIICATSWGKKEKFSIETMSVANVTSKLLKSLDKIGVSMSINSKPLEVSDPIPFEKDSQERLYDATLVNAWWRIMVSTYRVLRQYHVQFIGKTPPIGLMWGTLDLRDARYRGLCNHVIDPQAGLIRRNSVTDEQIEVGLWSGNSIYPRFAFYSFIYPQPLGIEKTKIVPKKAYWNAPLGEFILDYDDLRKSIDPENDLLAFFESTYRVGSELAGWDAGLIVPRTTVS